MFHVPCKSESERMAEAFSRQTKPAAVMPRMNLLINQPVCSIYNVFTVMLMEWSESEPSQR